MYISGRFCIWNELDKRNEKSRKYHSWHSSSNFLRFRQFFLFSISFFFQFKLNLLSWELRRKNAWMSCVTIINPTKFEIVLADFSLSIRSEIVCYSCQRRVSTRSICNLLAWRPSVSSRETRACRKQNWMLCVKKTGKIQLRTFHMKIVGYFTQFKSNFH